MENRSDTRLERLKHTIDGLDSTIENAPKYFFSGEKRIVDYNSIKGFCQEILDLIPNTIVEAQNVLNEEAYEG